MKKHRITFLPDEASVEVDEDTTIAAAAQRADVHINNLCGGQGVCGECRVLIRKGEATADEKASAFFSREEIEKGRQVYIVYPVIEESNDEDLKSLKSMYGKISRRFSSYSVEVFHGKMKVVTIIGFLGCIPALYFIGQVFLLQMNGFNI